MLLEHCFENNFDILLVVPLESEWYSSLAVSFIERRAAEHFN